LRYGGQSKTLSVTHHRGGMLTGHRKVLRYAQDDENVAVAARQR
jgi:hypothetical protein